MAYIALGANETGHVSIHIQASGALADEPEIWERWERACKAFIDVFAEVGYLAVSGGGPNHPLREHALAQARKDGAQIT